MATYTLDGDPLGETLESFLKLNDNLDPADVSALRGLKPGESCTIGGGAAAEFTVKRET